jgi:hypothetical protein
MTSLLTVLQGSADGIGSVRRFILCWLPMIPMLMRYCMAPAFTVIVAFGTAWSTARAAEDSFCRRYSKDAAAEIQRLNPLCRSQDDPRDPRYSLDIEVQYRWCLGVSVDEAKTESESRRKRKLTCR